MGHPIALIIAIAHVVHSLATVIFLRCCQKLELIERDLGIIKSTQKIVVISNT